MSQANVEGLRAAYSAMNDGYKTGDFGTLRQIMEETCAPDCTLEAGSSDVFTEGEWSGIDGLLSILTGQMEALEDVWVSPEDFVDVGDDRFVVPIRWGGRARHTGIAFEYSAAHVYTVKAGKAVRIQVFGSKKKALEAVGLWE
jgi:ketosteroid isomerase-like protein